LKALLEGKAFASQSRALIGDCVVQEELREVPLMGMDWRLRWQRMLHDNSTKQMLRGTGFENNN